MVRDVEDWAVEIDQRLATVLSEFARTMVTDFPIQSILDHLVGRIVDVLPIDAAGVSLISPGVDPRYVAASDQSAMRFERLQTELGEGPCLAAFETGEAVAIPDLRVDDRFPRFAERALEEGLIAVFTFPLRHDDDQLGSLDVYRTTVGSMSAAEMDAAQTLADVAASYLLNARARDELTAASDLAMHNSLHDALTGLPNRALLVERLEHAVLRCRRSENALAILFADLDRFKGVNDTYGHQAGDELLVAIAARLTSLLRPGDSLARLGGDEFVILCEDLTDPAQVEPIAERMKQAFATPFELTTSDVLIDASIGIAYSGRGENMPTQILQVADTAMYESKRNRRFGQQVRDLRAHAFPDRRVKLQADLAGALARGELRTVYQPIVSTSTGRVLGVEALLRWEHSTLGTVSPITIIPIAEQTNLIGDIGRWVLEQACLCRHQLQRHNGDNDLTVSVNVSVRQLMSSDFTATVAAVLADTKTDPGLVTLELTESVFIHDDERALMVLNKLKQIGVMIALDDFGTGYSSLGYLQRFPVDTVKMDQSFIAGLKSDNTSRFIIRAVIDLAHALRMAVVAEGVETDEQYQAIQTLDCDAYQGYLFARPAPAEHLTSMLAAR